MDLSCCKLDVWVVCGQIVYHNSMPINREPWRSYHARILQEGSVKLCNPKNVGCMTVRHEIWDEYFSSLNSSLIILYSVKVFRWLCMAEEM